MYNPYNADLARLRQQELIAEGDRDRTARAVRRAHRRRHRGPGPSPTRGLTS